MPTCLTHTHTRTHMTPITSLATAEYQHNITPLEAAEFIQEWDSRYFSEKVNGWPFNISLEEVLQQ